MKQPDWKTTAELVGILAIVASLIFVGLQLKQSQEIAIADQYQARADAALGFHLADMENSVSLQNIALGIRAAVDSGRLGDAVRRSMEQDGPAITAVRHARYRSLMTMYDNYHFQYEQGFLTEDSWLAFRTRLKGTLRNEINMAFYESMRDGGRPSFVAECNQILLEIAESGELSNSLE